MRPRTTLTAAAVLAVGALLGWLAASGRVPESLQAQDKATQKAQPVAARHDELAKLQFPSRDPMKDSAATLRDELLFQRATQVYLWALPLINTLGRGHACLGRRLIEPGRKRYPAHRPMLSQRCWPVGQCTGRPAKSNEWKSRTGKAQPATVAPSNAVVVVRLLPRR
jgi:hypothetical protein